ncbi:protein phosphatase PHLPP-like protein [Bacillus rossius redtenbacheri]|uniref:protein phosphatase PHLPP-like protein n=1 Tax=Bacillus rossius redtenbacheri TaxID=93214 RepID=UPI002FDDAC1C
MRALSLLDLQGNRVDGCKLPAPDGDDESSPLGRVNLRGNLLKGNIILGNYGNLTQLDVSENSIEMLDLSALGRLETVQCSRNCLRELTLCGRALVSLIAGNNKLRKLTVNPPPANLKHLDVSYNELEGLPEWTADCPRLVALFASHNRLRALPSRLFSGELARLQTAQLSHNRLASLPPFARPVYLHELFLQGNNLNTLPAGFFAATVRLRVLNVSNNRLCELPADTQSIAAPQLEKVYLTANCLSDSAMDVLGSFPNLRTLHAAYNCIAALPDRCVAAWQDLEELVLSGNRLQQLPESVVQLAHLRVLRVHSNRLDTIPCFARMSSLKVLDLAHNRLDRINLATLVPKQLQFLDLSCNSRLYVDPRQFQVYRSQRPMSLVDVSGQNRTSLPSTPYHEEGGDLEPPWKIGFSETPGLRDKLYVTQIRLPAFCNTEGLFAMFDGGNNGEVPAALVRAVPRILLEERTVKETAAEYMKYTMLSAHRELKEKGQKYGVCGTLCHISRARPSGPAAAPQPVMTGSGFVPGGQRYVLRVASVGEARAVLQRRSGAVALTRPPEASAACAQNNLNRSHVGYSSVFPLVIPDPHISEVILEENDEFLIIGNKRFWEVVDSDEAAEEVRDQPNPILAAKRLQDLAQGYGGEDNVSVLVVRFRDLGSEVEQLMRELRHTIRRSRRRAADHCSLCEEARLPSQQLQLQQQLPRRDCRDCSGAPDTERSSPSGQSDRAASDCGKDRFSPQPVLADGAPRKTFASLERRSHRDSKRGSGVARAIRARVEEDDGGGSGSDRSGTQLSEEQFKCWEYMLEQNTQLLFDKELDTLTRGFTRRPVLEPLWPRGGGGSVHKGRALSRSSPHLSEPCVAAAAVAPPAVFLSKHFGSARSFAPGARYPASRHFLNGGPNAAYFGSLQRLMPYNLEYNFAVMQEKAAALDSLEQDGRMQQYWEVATTEL